MASWACRDAKVRRPMAKKTDSEPSYWAVTKEPRYALALVLPMLVTYQLGLLALARLDRGAPEVRNVADLYVQWVMVRFGLVSRG